jgi:transcriptional regulator with XRE-family HTH domain
VRRVTLSNPLDSRLLLGQELRRLRQAKGMTMREVAGFLDCSEPRISRLETGKLTGATLKPGELRRLLSELYDVTDPDKAEELLQLLREAEQTAWWHPYEDVLPSGMDTYLGLQTAATRERALETVLVHGLLQTPDYARAVLTEVGVHSPGAVDRLVDLRTQRARLLHRTDPGPLQLEVLHDEAALRRRVGGPAVMRAQLEALLQAGELPNVTIRIVPFAAGVHAGGSGSFALIQTEDSTQATGYVDSPAGNLLLSRARDIRDLTAIYNRVRAKALSPENSTAFIQQVAEET